MICLLKLDGRAAETSQGEVILETADLATRVLEKNLLETLLEFLADPNVSFLLLTIGGLGIVIELFNPGLIAPVVVGVICLILAFVALGNLPVNWAGVALILLAIILAAAEVVVAGFGILGIASGVSLVIGGLLLFAQFGDASPTLPNVAVNRWLVVGIGLASGGRRAILCPPGGEIPQGTASRDFGLDGRSGGRCYTDPRPEGHSLGGERQLDGHQCRRESHRNRGLCNNS